MSQSQPVDQVTVTIDGIEITVPKGTLVIRAAELLGIQIPRFCDHPLLEPVGACRQCLVEVEGQRKPLASCTTTVTEGMVVHTQLTSTEAAAAQQGTMELLLINHPLDCPVCDKGGECPLQNQAMSTGQAESRFHDTKRTFPKPIAVSSQVLLDRERCVLCARCTRFSDQIAGDPFITFAERGASQQVSAYVGDGTSNEPEEPFQSYFSGNTVQICPVGALTGAAYRFRARPFDLVSTPSVCEHCASGCSQRTDHRRGKILRRLAGEDPQVNQEWNCDKGRWAFTYTTANDRLTTPLIRNDEGELVEASWTQAIARAAAGLRAARSAGGVGILTGGRLTVEDAYAYSTFARLVAETNDVDFRSRPHSAEEAEFLAACIAGGTPATGAVTYRDIDSASSVLVVGLEPEEESPMIFLRLRKSVRARKLPVIALSPWLSPGLAKLQARLVSAAPGQEPSLLEGFAGLGPIDDEYQDISDLMQDSAALILVGERMAAIPGALSAAARLASRTGARLAWIPRRAGDRGALEAGLLPGLLPGGRPVTDEVARGEVAAVWECTTDAIPSAMGRDTAGIVKAAAAGDLSGLVIAGVDVDDLPDPASARQALEQAEIVISLELRRSCVSDYADVVFPVASTDEKAGSYLDWEGRARYFNAVHSRSSNLTDARVLGAIAAELGIELACADVSVARSQLMQLGQTHAPRMAPPARRARADRSTVQPGQAILSTWHHLLDAGSLQDNEPHLAGTARKPVVRLSPGTASDIKAVDGDQITVSSEVGQVTLMLEITAMPDQVVWVPTKSGEFWVYRDLGLDSGMVVNLAVAKEL